MEDTPAYRLGPGDRLRITVFNEETLSGEYEIDGSGTLSLKLIGPMPANNKTIQALASEIETALQQGYLRDPHVSIDVLNYRPFYVLGEVKEPGQYPYVSGMTVLNAVALAGGFTYRARETRVSILRTIDNDRHERQADENAVVMPGDIIRVPERFF